MSDSLPRPSDPTDFSALARRLREAEAERDRLQRVLESRPRADETMPRSYVAWSSSVESLATFQFADE